MKKYDIVYLVVAPLNVTNSFLILAKLLEEVVDLLKPATCIKAFAAGAVLNVIVIVFAVVVVENDVVGTPASVT